MSDRAGYLNLGQSEVTASPRVMSFTGKDGSTIAVVDLGEVTMHVVTVAGARALADAFTRAADLIEAAEVTP